MLDAAILSYGFPFCCLSGYCFDDLEDMCCAHAIALQLAARIAVSNLHKNTLKSFSKT